MFNDIVYLTGFLAFIFLFVKITNFIIRLIVEKYEDHEYKKFSEERTILNIKADIRKIFIEITNHIHCKKCGQTISIFNYQVEQKYCKNCINKKEK